MLNKVAKPTQYKLSFFNSIKQTSMFEITIDTDSGSD